MLPKNKTKQYNHHLDHQIISNLIKEDIQIAMTIHVLQQELLKLRPQSSNKSLLYRKNRVVEMIFKGVYYIMGKVNSLFKIHIQKI